MMTVDGLRVALALLLSAGCVGDVATTTEHDASVADGAAPQDGGPDGAEAGCTSTTYREIVLADRPVFYFRLGEATNATAALDELDAGTGGTYHGAQSGEPGALACDTNTAASFDGGAVIDLNNVPDFAGTAPFTLEAWAKPAYLDSAKFWHLFSNEYTDDAGLRQGYALVLGYGGYGFGIERAVNGPSDGGLIKAIAATPADTASYTHVVGVYNGSALQLYINGVAGPTNSDTRSMKGHAPLLAAYLGAFADTSRDFHGALDEVAVYDHALTPERVAAHYSKGAFGH